MCFSILVNSFSQFSSFLLLQYWRLQLAPSRLFAVCCFGGRMGTSFLGYLSRSSSASSLHLSSSQDSIHCPCLFLVPACLPDCCLYLLYIPLPTLSVNHHHGQTSKKTVSRRPLAKQRKGPTLEAATRESSYELGGLSPCEYLQRLIHHL